MIRTGLLALLATACSYSTTNIVMVDDDASAPGAAEANDAGASTTIDDAGVELDADSGTDAAVDAGEPAPDPFANLPPFGGCEPPYPDSSTHPPTYAGTRCLEGCHAVDTTTTHAKFLFAGTVFQSTGTPAPERIEVRVHNLDLDQTLGACTDTNGNFWVARKDAFPARAAAGVRNENGSAYHATVVSSGDCNACHAGGARIVMP